MPITDALATRADPGGLAAKLGEIATKSDLSDLESRILRELRSQRFWFFGMLISSLGIAVAIIKLFP